MRIIHKATGGWSNMGSTLKAGEKAMVAGVEYTQQQCYLKALEWDIGNAKAWYGLGLTLKGDQKVTIAGTDYTEQQCYVNVLEGDIHHNEAWEGLYSTLHGDEGANIHGIQLSIEECKHKKIRKQLEVIDNQGKQFVAAKRKAEKIKAALARERARGDSCCVIC
eukprot:Tbor_TRINITY_DN237_c0_g1::TRINITY_DN237_c0_g1_i1::g.12191::m.12191